MIFGAPTIQLRRVSGHSVAVSCAPSVDRLAARIGAGWLERNRKIPAEVVKAYTPKNDLSISNFAMLRNASPVFLAVLFRITAPEIPLATAT
jgi:hypothetical protein